jgi:AAA family ATP:ADP antiporter
MVSQAHGGEISPVHVQQRYERWKTVLLAICFFVVLGGYSIVKELKDFVFLKIVGWEYISEAKLYSILVLIPLVFLYSRFVDVLHRHQLLCMYALLYSIGGLACAYYIGHPTIGLANTDTGHGRLFGWIFYFFMEGYSPFVVSLLWAFFNSVTKPDAVKDSYVTMTIATKIGGIAVVGAALILLSLVNSGSVVVSMPALVQILLAVASLAVLLAPLAVMILMRTVPKKYLHGYEAVYRFEREREKKGLYKGFWGAARGIFDGLYVFFRYPYVLGIFGMIFFWEVINVTFNIIRLRVGETCTNTPVEFLQFLLEQVFFVHLVGLFIVLIGTRALVAWLGERRSLIAIPVLTGIALAYYLAFQTLAAATVAYVLMRAINYSLAYPLRESLYIPTTKNMKFKTKSWIDGFGQKIAKASGGSYSWLTQHAPATSVFSIHIMFFACVIGIWSLTAHLLGKRFEQAVKDNEVIGAGE